MHHFHFFRCLSFLLLMCTISLTPASLKKTTLNNSKPNQPAKPAKTLTLAEGKAIYDRYCAICHTGKYPGAPVTGDKKVWKLLIQKKGIPTLITNTIKGLRNMPPRGSCANCTDNELKAAVIYMVEQSKTEGDYTLWLKTK